MTTLKIRFMIFVIRSFRYLFHMDPSSTAREFVKTESENLIKDLESNLNDLQI
jgi:hypothetical protein